MWSATGSARRPRTRCSPRAKSATRSGGRLARLQRHRFAIAFSLLAALFLIPVLSLSPTLHPGTPAISFAFTPLIFSSLLSSLLFSCPLLSFVTAFSSSAAALEMSGSLTFLMEAQTLLVIQLVHAGVRADELTQAKTLRSSSRNESQKRTSRIPSPDFGFRIPLPCASTWFHSLPPLSPLYIALLLLRGINNRSCTRKHHSTFLY